MKKKEVIVIIVLVLGIAIVFGFYFGKKNADAKDNNDVKDYAPPAIEHGDLDKNVVSTTEIIDGEFTTKNGFKGYVKDDITYIEGIMIVNKTYSLPASYGSGLTKDTEEAFYKMQSAALNEGLHIFVKSGYRSYIDQKIIYNGYVSEDGKDVADRYSARPGYSEHQSGYAVDLNTLETTFENTPEGIWLRENAYKYGFILRYTKDGENITGYMYEPWHYRFVGVDLATKLYNNGTWTTLEDYFGIDSKYEDV